MVAVAVSGGLVLAALVIYVLRERPPPPRRPRRIDLPNRRSQRARAIVMAIRRRTISGGRRRSR
jgi:hypothetical protein